MGNWRRAEVELAAYSGSERQDKAAYIHTVAVSRPARSAAKDVRIRGKIKFANQGQNKISESVQNKIYSLDARHLKTVLLLLRRTRHFIVFDDDLGKEN